MTNDREDTCPECEAHLLSRRQGLSYMVRCSACEWAAASTYLHPIHRDTAVYSVFVTSLGANPAHSLIYLNQRFTHGIARTRDLFSSGEQCLLQGSAWDVSKEVHRLRQEGVPFRIEPAFTYDLDDPTVASDYCTEWMPFVTESIGMNQLK